MKRDLPALPRPAGDPDGFGLGVRAFGGWRYACVACSTTCEVRVRWKHTGNKSNGWGLYAWQNGSGHATFCPDCAVAETRDRARAAA